MRVVDTLMGFPYVLLAILLVAALGPGLVNAMLAVAIANLSFHARGVRSAVLLIRGQEYVEAARAVGATNPQIITRQILPNVLPTAFVTASLKVGWMITETAGLSFIGLGAQPPTADHDARRRTRRHHRRLSRRHVSGYRDPGSGDRDQPHR